MMPDFSVAIIGSGLVLCAQPREGRTMFIRSLASGMRLAFMQYGTSLSISSTLGLLFCHT